MSTDGSTQAAAAHKGEPDAPLRYPGSQKAVDNGVAASLPLVTFSVMASSVHDLPEEIVLTREEYRLQHAALEAALDVLDREPTADADGTARLQIENALRMLLRRIWPYLDELDEHD